MNEEIIKAIPSNRLQFFPVMIFATTFLIITTALFFITLFTYFLKIIKYKEEVVKELNHPIRINFFAASSISILILSAAFREYSLDISLSFFYFGAILHIFFTYYTIQIG